MIILLSVRRYLSVGTCVICKPVHWFVLQGGGLVYIYGAVFNAEGYFWTEHDNLVCRSLLVSFPFSILNLI